LQRFQLAQVHLRSNNIIQTENAPRLKDITR